MKLILWQPNLYELRENTETHKTNYKTNWLYYSHWNTHETTWILTWHRWNYASNMTLTFHLWPWKTHIMNIYGKLHFFIMCC